MLCLHVHFVFASFFLSFFFLPCTPPPLATLPACRPLARFRYMGNQPDCVAHYSTVFTATNTDPKTNIYHVYEFVDTPSAAVATALNAQICKIVRLLLKMRSDFVLHSSQPGSQRACD